MLSKVKLMKEYNLTTDNSSDFPGEVFLNLKGPENIFSPSTMSDGSPQEHITFCLS